MVDEDAFDGADVIMDICAGIPASRVRGPRTPQSLTKDAFTWDQAADHAADGNCESETV